MLKFVSIFSMCATSDVWKFNEVPGSEELKLKVVVDPSCQEQLHKGTLAKQRFGRKVECKRAGDCLQVCVEGTRNVNLCACGGRLTLRGVLTGSCSIAQDVVELLESEVGPCTAIIGVGVEDQDLVSSSRCSAGWIDVVCGCCRMDAHWYLATMVSINPVFKTIKSYSRSSIVGSPMAMRSS